MAAKRVVITGAAGQDGTYLAESLRARGDEVHGIVAPGDRLRVSDVSSHALDIRDHERFANLIRELHPDECYHLAAYHQSSSRTESEAADERTSIETNVLSTQTLLSILRSARPDCHVFLAGSCHMFGDANETPQTERTPFAPTNVYGITKVASTQLGRMYRDRHGMFVCTGILYNHESPLRGPSFVTSIIARAAVEISQGKRTELVLGNVESEVDWGFAGDYVLAMQAMLSAEQPKDYIISSGALHRVRDFCEIAFRHVGLDWSAYVKQDPTIYRPPSRTVYFGDSSAIRRELGWTPRVTFEELVTMMVDRSIDKRA